ncbi:hypothetical protein [Flavobacterium sp. 123]|uniref:hypothetical protein n=1 Tax=Flavobacterium sp. 123 TaxID=2135627 RepID=UPI000EAE191C|nr:hypothetical protein [Flavobacterium sp. 123]RKT00169.1 hypothetical protein C8C88_1988 [Flavobacterium sp. 123]
MQILTDLNTKLLKTGYVNVLESNDNRKVSFEIAKVLKDSGEGQHFLLQAGARKQLKMLSWSHWQARWVWRLFYINDIIASLQKPKKQYKSFVMNYNTQLCNTAWGKKLLARVTQCTCFCSKTVTVIFFGALAKECQSKGKMPFFIIWVLFGFYCNGIIFSFASSCSLKALLSVK